MLVNTSRQGHLVLCLRTSGSGQGDLREISLDSQNTSSDLRSSDVDEELLSGGQLLDLQSLKKSTISCRFASSCRRAAALTFACFLSVVFTPKSRRNKKTMEYVFSYQHSQPSKSYTTHS